MHRGLPLVLPKARFCRDEVRRDGTADADRFGKEGGRLLAAKSSAVSARIAMNFWSTPDVERGAWSPRPPAAARIAADLSGRKHVGRGCVGSSELDYMRAPPIQQPERRGMLHWAFGEGRLLAHGSHVTRQGDDRPCRNGPG